MSQPLPNLSSLSRKLADANLRIDRVIENLPGALDHLIQAADRKQWNEVSRLSQMLAKSCQEQGVPLDAPAKEVAGSAAEQSEPQIKRALLRLIGASGRLRRQGNTSSQSASSEQNIVQPE
ncbi:MAG: hypothetical protein IAF94_11470 [Pirellulaceae bacterium]|nr:hypothetical protein [Pirellulaceae bacterium]